MPRSQLKSEFSRLNFWEVLRAGLHYFASPGAGKTSPGFPMMIDRYQFSEPLFPNRKHNKFTFARYTDGNGGVFIAKQIDRRDKSLESYWFRNEAVIYNFFERIGEGERARLVEKFPNVKIPKFVGVIEDSERLLMLTEMVTGEDLTILPEDKRISVMARVIEYFREASRAASAASLGRLARREMWHLGVLIWPVYVRSILRHPNLGWPITSMLLNFLAQLPFLVRQSDRCLNHRDLSYVNILYDQKTQKIWPIDFELATWTHPMVEVVQMVVACWKRPGFIQYFEKSPAFKEIQVDPVQYRLYRSLSLYSAIHSLATAPEHAFDLSRRYFKYIHDLPNQNLKPHPTNHGHRFTRASDGFFRLLRLIRSPIVRFLKPKGAGPIWRNPIDPLEPISVRYGYDRGTPIDRVYIESFLNDHQSDIHGHCLEVHDDQYTQRFGGEKVTRSDVLDVDRSNGLANIHGNLEDLIDVIPDNTYDCLIINHTLNLIANIESAIGECVRILKPGGVLLATLPGPIAPVNNLDTGYWRLTVRAAEHLFRKHFEGKNMLVGSRGNVIAGQAFLTGLAKEEILEHEVQYSDRRFPISIEIRAIKS